MNVTHPAHNLDAHLLGTGEFALARNATAAAANAGEVGYGFLDFGNTLTITPSFEVSTVAHQGAYRGKLVRDRTKVTGQQLDYVIRCDEWKKSLLTVLFGGEAGSGHTQTIISAAAIDALAFTADAPSGTTNWYDLKSSGNRLMRLTTVVLITSGSGNSVVAEADDETFTDVAHGLSNGDPIAFTAAALPTGISAGTVYYVVNKTNDTFQVALTVGGSAVTFSTDGTTVLWWPVLDPATDYEVDLKLARVRFLVDQTDTVTPTVTAPAITSSDATFLNSITPLQDLDWRGIGRLVIYDQDGSNDVLLDHRDFECEVRAESIGEVNGTAWSDFQFRITVNAAAPGELYVREA